MADFCGECGKYLFGEEFPQPHGDFTGDVERMKPGSYRDFLCEGIDAGHNYCTVKTHHGKVFTTNIPINGATWGDVIVGLVQEAVDQTKTMYEPKAMLELKEKAPD